MLGHIRQSLNHILHAIFILLFALDCDCSTTVATFRCGFHRHLAHLTGFPGIGFRSDPYETPLNKTKGIGTNPLDIQSLANYRCQIFAERTGSQLHIAMGIGFRREAFGDGASVRSTNPLAHCHNTTAMLVHTDGDILHKLIHRKRTLRDINQMRTIIGVLTGECGCCGQKTGVASHDYIDFHPAQRAIVQIISAYGTGNETPRRTITGRMIIAEQIIVNRFGNMETAHFIALAFGFFGDDIGRLGRVISADIEEITDISPRQNLKNLAAIIRRRLPAHRSQCGARRLRDIEQDFFGFGSQIDKSLIKDALNPMKCAINLDNFIRRFRRQHCTNQTLIDYHRWAATLGNQHIPDHCLLLCIKRNAARTSSCSIQKKKLTSTLWRCVPSLQ